MSERLLRALGDGASHSGETLARRFGVTRAAISKQVRKLADWGLEVHAVPGVGYRLERPLDLIDRAALVRSVRAPLAALTVHTELDSTNRFLLDRRAPPAGALHVAIAEYQSAGRGRRGRRWIAPLGSGLCLSVGWQFAGAPTEIAALSLAVGVVVRRVLARTAGVSVALKWPNDLVFDERKLGGILLELKAEAQGVCHVVTGVGLNVALPRALHRKLCDWPSGAIDLATATGGSPPSRTALAAALIDALAALFANYATEGFAPYRADWRAADFLAGRPITLDTDGARLAGKAVGVEADGALVVETASGVRRRVAAGDVSVRSV